MSAEDWAGLKDPSKAGFSDKEKTALAFAEKLTRAPWEVGDADVGALKKYFSDAEIVDLDVLVGLANLTNRFTDPMGLELEFPAEKV